MNGDHSISMKKLKLQTLYVTQIKNTETIDSYVTQTRQVATLLGYGESQVLEVFKNTLPTKLYWILFPKEELRQVVKTAKRILTKEKLDKQLTGQTSTSPFMNIRDGTERKVSFNARDELGEKIDKLTVQQIYKVEVRIGPIIREVIRIEVVGQTVETEDSIEIIDLDKTIITIFEGTLEDMEDKITEENIEIIGTMSITVVGIGQEKRHS